MVEVRELNTGEGRATPARTVRAAAVYAAIETRIMNRTLLPGQHINIDALARELNVSPTPVREALGRLAAERYLVLLPYKGYAVVQLPTPRQLADMMGVRRLLETEAARQAVVRATATHLHAIRQELDTIAAALADDTVDTRRWRVHSRAIHQLLMRAADNDPLYEVWRSLKATFEIARMHQGVAEVDYPVALAEHRAIYEAIRARDVAAAAAAVCAHIDAAEERMVGAL
jgi:DNA-binding GntR family transcriptional regulator